MLRNISFVFALILGLSSFGQRVAIVGNILDSISLEPIPYANAVVYPKGNLEKPLMGTMTDSVGAFKMNKLKKQDYSLRISSIGYQTKSIEISKEDFHGDSLILKSLPLVPVFSNMDEVVIEAKIERFEMDADKLTMNVDKDLSSTVDNAFDLLKKVPGVFIDKDENITLNGSSGILFQFNGRDRKIQWAALTSMLKGMSPDQIEKFEIVTNPSSKYDSEGTSGIINIKFVSNKNYGLNGSINARTSYEHDFSLNGSASLNYVDDKWTNSLNYSRSQWNSKGFSESKSYTSIGNGDTLLMSSRNDYRWEHNGDNINLNLDYMIDTNNSIGLGFSYNKSYRPWIDNIIPTYLSSYPNYSQIDSSYINNNGSKSDNESYYLSINYTHLFDTIGTKLTSDFSASMNNSNSDNERDIRYYLFDDMDNLMRWDAFYQNTISKNSNYNFSTDMVRPFDKTSRIEFGIKASLSVLDNNFSSQIKDSITNDYINNSDRSNHFQYYENINSLYASYSKTFNKKTTLRLGLRTEQTNTKGYQVVLDSANTNSYINLFPNISLSHAFSMDNRLSLSYGYRISRPSYSSLNPFLEKRDDYYYSKGNPMLDPQFTHNVRLSYSLKYAFFPSLSYSYTTNNVTNLVERDSLSMVRISTPYNLRNSQSLNLGFSFNKEIFKWWDVFAYSHASYSKTTSIENLGIDYENLSFSISASSTFTLPKKYRISLYYYYSSGGMYGMYKYNGWRGGDISLSKSFLKDKLSTSFSIGNLLVRKNSESEYAYNGIYTKSRSTGSKPRYSIGIRYNFGRMYEAKKLQKIRSQSEDSRVSGDSSPR